MKKHNTVMRWFNINSNPNSTEARDWRRETLDSTWQPAIRDRQKHIASLCSGHTVLDVGCVDHFVDGKLLAGLFQGLAKAASRCVGVDINEIGVTKLKEEGYSAVVGDITSREFVVPSPGAFDVVVVGEVIEHITDLETFFINLKRCMHQEGLLVITSPNPYFLSHLLLALKYRQFENVDHVTYVFPSGMAELADRFGLTLASWRGVECFVSPRSLVQWSLQKLACATYRGCILHCNTLIYEMHLRVDTTPGK
jgi:2-polyprenyl-3-methyl-5-hydroxy-6-metoxy-1,4-benzoquinol methylase